MSDYKIKWFLTYSTKINLIYQKTAKVCEINDNVVEFYIESIEILYRLISLMLMVFKG